MYCRSFSLAAAAFAVSAALPGLAQAEALFGLTTTNALVSFDSAAPLMASQRAITGLAVGEQILGIDTRPANGSLVGLSSLGKLYTLDGASGAATLLSTLSTPLSGSSFGVDFNPTVDRLRVTSNTGQNLRINVDTGAVTVDGALNGATSGLNASAYTNSFAGATTTTLYGISAVTDMLYTQNPPNNGTLAAVGALGVDTIGTIGFDISGSSGVAYASFTDGSNGKSSLYTLNLATGAATLVGAFGIGGNAAVAAPLMALAVSPVPEPTSYALFIAGLAGVVALARRRRR
jgi:hypothetical protein